tara:strand:+ start:259 stop:579 length:321 start_codon:yes stop_codon:yes gene_type:complete
MANQTVMQAVDAMESKFPNMPAVGVLAVCDVLDRSRTNSVDSVVEEMKRLMLLTDATPCEVLSAFVKDTLLSETDHPCHVYGIDFAEVLNEVMCPNHTGSGVSNEE